MPKLDVSLIVVGINYWDDITGPCIASIQKCEPEAKIVLIDNCSFMPYPTDLPNVHTVRLTKRVGYNHALNAGIQTQAAKQYVCMNNDNIVRFPFIEQVKELRRDTLYGSDFNWDRDNELMFYFSAWLVISERILGEVGFFDPLLVAGFEDFDYQQRARNAGFFLDLADLPITHLDKRTRVHEPEYNERWNRCREYFAKKHGFITHEWEPVKDKRIEPQEL